MLIGLQALALALLTAAPTIEACEADHERRIAAELETIQAGMSVYASTPQSEWTTEQQDLMGRTMDLLSARDRPVSRLDLDILDRALDILHDESVWDRADDRQCEPSDTRWSIFCALHQASIAVSGQYEHRRTALQEVRFIIQDRSEGRDYAHRMMDYNNDPATRFDEARSAIREAREVVAARLAGQCPG